MAYKPKFLTPAEGGLGASTTATSGKFLIGDSTNWIASTPTLPNSATGTGKVLIADGTNWVASTPTFPNIATGTGTILRADGTNWVATTATYPATTTVSQILYSSATNVISGLATGNNGILSTGNTGIPAVLAGPGTTGNVLQSNAAAAPSFSTATYPSVATGTGKVLIADGTNWVASTPTFPNASATIRKMIVSDGTNWVASTETWAVPGTSGNLLTSDGTNWTSAAAASSGPSVISVQLTNSQIKNLNATPVQILAAPGAGKVYNVLSVSARLNYGGTNIFTAGASQTIALIYGTSASVVTAVTNAMLVAAAVRYALFLVPVVITNGTVANYDNLAINAKNGIATEISGNAANDNTVTIQVVYTIIQA